MERFYLLAPALLLLAVFSIGLVIYASLHATGRVAVRKGVKHNLMFGPFFGQFLVWILTPAERLLVGRVSANTITSLSLLMCALTGIAAGTGHLVAAVWTYVLAGIFDALDGRLARLNGEQTSAGALFDSVSDRWGELFALTGYAWYLRETPWFLAVMAVIAGSMMVSYTRARAEGLGLNLRGGLMQRAERMVLVSAGTLIAAWYVHDPLTTHLVVPIIGGTMVAVGVASVATALTRWLSAYRELVRRAAEPLVIEETPEEAQPLPFVPAKLRESAELGL